jgi:hypothetical protein
VIVVNVEYPGYFCLHVESSTSSCDFLCMAVYHRVGGLVCSTGGVV